jgi:hypothetical protein
MGELDGRVRGVVNELNEPYGEGRVRVGGEVRNGETKRLALRFFVASSFSNPCPSPSFHCQDGS